VALAMAILMTNRGVPLIYYGDEIGLPGAGDPDNRRMMAWNGWNEPQKQLLAQMKKLGQLRKDMAVLRRGVRTTEWIGQDAWVYKMSDASGSVYVAINRSDAPVNVGGLPAGSLKDSVSGESVSGPEVSVPARAFRVFPVKP
jgi:glycosidase